MTIDNWRHQYRRAMISFHDEMSFKLSSTRFIWQRTLSVIMEFSLIVLFIFIFIIQIDEIFSLWKKSTGGLEDYVIDVLFSNSLTIIRCNPYERQILRDISIETVGYIKCSNRESFLPENHIQSITLLRWNSTIVKCSKDKKSIKEEKTHLDVKHKGKNAFKKVDFNLIRVGSMGPSVSKMDEKKFRLSFEHPPRNLASIVDEQQNGTLAIQTFSFKHRPILCRERQLPDGGPCANLHINLSYICYYRVSSGE